ncbi:MAG: glycosyltransferase family 1 protein [Bacteroidota bacterium]
MKIAINARFLIPNKMEGFGRITYEVTKKLVEKNPNDTFYLFFDRPHNGLFNFGKNAIPVVLSPPARHPFLWYIWFEWSIYFALKRIKPDVFFSPDGYTCLRSPVKTLLMVHDISFVHFPNFVPYLVRKYYEYFTPKFLQKSDRLITLTNHALQDISNFYQIPRTKFDVTTVAAHGAFEPVSLAQKQLTLEKYSSGQEYFLYVGAIHPRKNIDRLILAFDAFKKSSNSTFKLLIVGRFLYGKREILKIYEKSDCKDDICFLGYLDKDLYAVMGSAHALTYISNYEGFGMPLVEAMNCHVPSITSNVSSMPEVAGPTAILVDPSDVDQIANAMYSMAFDETLYQSLKNNCISRKRNFDWEKTSTDIYNSLSLLHDVEQA